jgi:hypothetical protein
MVLKKLYSSKSLKKYKKVDKKNKNKNAKCCFNMSFLKTKLKRLIQSD